MNLVELLKDQVIGTIAGQAASFLGAPEQSVAGQPTLTPGPRKSEGGIGALRVFHEE